MGIDERRSANAPVPPVGRTDDTTPALVFREIQCAKRSCQRRQQTQARLRYTLFSCQSSVRSLTAETQTRRRPEGTFSFTFLNPDKDPRRVEGLPPRIICTNQLSVCFLSTAGAPEVIWPGGRVTPRRGQRAPAHPQVHRDANTMSSVVLNKTHQGRWFSGGGATPAAGF